MPTLLRVRPWDRGWNHHSKVPVALGSMKAPPTEVGPVSVLEFDQPDWLSSSLEAQVAQW